MRAKQTVQLIQAACEDKKAEDIVILDIRKLSSIADYFVVASGTSDRHVRAIADNVVDSLRAKKVKCYHEEGLQESRWVLLDFSDVMVHIFHPETRKFYNIERLWGEEPPRTRKKIQPKSVK